MPIPDQEAILEGWRRVAPFAGRPRSERRGSATRRPEYEYYGLQEKGGGELLTDEEGNPLPVFRQPTRGILGFLGPEPTPEVLDRETGRYGPPGDRENALAAMRGEEPLGPTGAAEARARQGKAPPMYRLREMLDRAGYRPSGEDDEAIVEAFRRWSNDVLGYPVDPRQGIPPALEEELGRLGS